MTDAGLGNALSAVTGAVSQSTGGLLGSSSSSNMNDVIKNFDSDLKSLQADPVGCIGNLSSPQSAFGQFAVKLALIFGPLTNISSAPQQNILLTAVFGAREEVMNFIVEYFSTYGVYVDETDLLIFMNISGCFVSDFNYNSLVCPSNANNAMQDLIISNYNGAYKNSMEYAKVVDMYKNANLLSTVPTQSQFSGLVKNAFSKVFNMSTTLFNIITANGNLISDLLQILYELNTIQMKLTGIDIYRNLSDHLFEKFFMYNNINSGNLIYESYIPISTNTYLPSSKTDTGFIYDASYNISNFTSFTQATDNGNNVTYITNTIQNKSYTYTTDTTTKKVKCTNQSGTVINSAVKSVKILRPNPALTRITGPNDQDMNNAYNWNTTGALPLGPAGKLTCFVVSSGYTIKVLIRSISEAEDFLSKYRDNFKNIEIYIKRLNDKSAFTSNTGAATIFGFNCGQYIVAAKRSDTSKISDPPQTPYAYSKYGLYHLFMILYQQTINYNEDVRNAMILNFVVNAMDVGLLVIAISNPLLAPACLVVAGLEIGATVIMRNQVQTNCSVLTNLAMVAFQSGDICRINYSDTTTTIINSKLLDAYDWCNDRAKFNLTFLNYNYSGNTAVNVFNYSTYTADVPFLDIQSNDVPLYSYAIGNLAPSISELSSNTKFYSFDNPNFIYSWIHAYISDYLKDFKVYKVSYTTTSSALDGATVPFSTNVPNKRYMPNSIITDISDNMIRSSISGTTWSNTTLLNFSNYKNNTGLMKRLAFKSVYDKLKYLHTNTLATQTAYVSSYNTRNYCVSQYNNAPSYYQSFYYLSKIMAINDEYVYRIILMKSIDELETCITKMNDLVYSKFGNVTSGSFNSINNSYNTLKLSVDSLSSFTSNRSSYFLLVNTFINTTLNNITLPTEDTTVKNYNDLMIEVHKQLNNFAQANKSTYVYSNPNNISLCKVC